MAVLSVGSQMGFKKKLMVWKQYLLHGDMLMHECLWFTDTVSSQTWASSSLPYPEAAQPGRCELRQTLASLSPRN